MDATIFAMLEHSNMVSLRNGSSESPSEFHCFLRSLYEIDAVIYSRAHILSFSYRGN